MSAPVTENDPSVRDKEPERLSRDQMNAAKEEIWRAFERGGAEDMNSVGLLDSRATLALRNRIDAREIIEFFLEQECPGNPADPGYLAIRMNEKRKGLRCWQEAIGRELRRHDQWSPDAGERQKYEKGAAAWKNFMAGVEWVIETTQTGVGHPDRAATRALDVRLFLQVAWGQIRAGRDEFPEHYRAGLPGMDEKAAAWAGWMAHSGDGVAIMDLHAAMMAHHERDSDDTATLPRMQDVGRTLLRYGRAEAVAFMNSVAELTDKFSDPELARAIHFFDVIGNVATVLERPVREEVAEFLQKHGMNVLAAARQGQNEKLVLRFLVRMAWTLDEVNPVSGFGARRLLEDARMKPFLTGAFHFLVEKKKIEVADILAAHIDSDDVLRACAKSKTLQKKKNGALIWGRKRLADVASGTERPDPVNAPPVVRGGRRL